MTYYKGINRKQSYMEATKEQLAKFWRYSDSPFVIYEEDLISLTNKAWDISKGEARRNPALKLPKEFKKFDFCVIQYGKKTYPHVPKICLLNEELFDLTNGEYNPESVNFVFFDFMDFINAQGVYAEKDI